MKMDGEIFKNLHLGLFLLFVAKEFGKTKQNSTIKICCHLLAVKELILPIIVNMYNC